MYNYVQIIVQEVRKVQMRRSHIESKKGIIGTIQRRIISAIKNR